MIDKKGQQEHNSLTALVEILKMVEIQSQILRRTNKQTTA